MWLSGLSAGWSAEGLVVAVGVESEVAEEFAGGGVDDPHVQVGDEDQDAGSGVFVAQADVVQAALVAKGDASGLVDDVVADPPVGVAVAFSGGGFGSGLVGGSGHGSASQGRGTPWVAQARRKASTTLGPLTRW